MMIVVWGILIYIGYNTERLRLKSFLVMVAVIIPLTLGYDFLRIQSAKSLGEDESFRLHPIVVAGDVFVTWSLWSITYLIGFAIGKWRRRKQRRAEKDVEPFL